jgi:hypothetical protein
MVEVRAVHEDNYPLCRFPPLHRLGNLNRK